MIRTIRLLAAFLLFAPPLIPAGEPVELLRESGVKGGLVVHLGCGDGRLTLALRANDSYLVQGLDAEAANVEKARATIFAAGLYGPVTVDRLAGSKLPVKTKFITRAETE